MNTGLKSMAVTPLVLLLAACAAATTYQGIAATDLSDEQLVEELQSAAAGFGIELDRSMYLMAVRPDPAYVLTSSTHLCRRFVVSTRQGKLWVRQARRGATRRSLR